jgi:protein O-GlcNAc transferase
MNQPNPVTAQWRQAVARYQAGDLGGAEALLRALVASHSRNADAWALLGVVLSARGDHSAGCDLLRRAIALTPHPGHWNNLGEVLRATGDLAGALSAYDKALSLDERFPMAHYNRGNVLKLQGRPEDAIAAYQRALALQPDYASAAFNLGNTQREQGRLPAAVTAYRQALAIRPDWPDALTNLGATLGEMEEADQALGCYRRVLELSPERVELFDNIAAILENQGRPAEARQSFAQAQTGKPTAWWKRFRAETILEAIALDNGEIDRERQRVADVLANFQRNTQPIELAELHQWAIEPSMTLVYHGRDERPLREQYYALFGERISPCEPTVGIGIPHVGVVVTRGHEGVFWKCLGGLVERLPTAELRISLVCHRSGANILRERFRNSVLGYVVIPDRLDQATEVLRAARFDALHFWEVGTGASNYFLPYLRTAPLQSATWGWPVTTGNPRVDFYVSSNLLEPSDGEAHYTEKLIRLPGLLTRYVRPSLTPNPPGRSRWGLSNSQHIYLCSQNLRKYHPDFDALIAGILRGDPDGAFVLLADRRPALTTRLLARMSLAMPDVIDRVRVLPRLPESEYLALLAVVDGVLDTPHYGGGANTLLDAAAVGAPVVTLPGRFHRGRWGLAVNRQLGVDELSATSPEVYIAQAVRLGRDAEYNRDVRRRIRERSDGLFSSEEAVMELCEFFLREIQRRRDSLR